MNHYQVLPPRAGFLGLEDVPDRNEPERAVVIPFGLEHSVSYATGTAQGPQAILDASRQVELFDEEFWCEPWRRYGLTTLAVADIPADTGAALDLLAGLVGAVLDEQRFPLTLGGEHTLTAGAIRAFAERHGRVGILHLDAHADLRDSYLQNRYSHACAIRRCLDHANVEVVSAGIRNISSEEVAFYESGRERVRIHWAREQAAWNLQQMLEPIAGLPVYLSIDVDVLDASLMPATGTPEPGGLFWEQMLTIIRTAALRCSIVGADITELAPAPGLHSCEFTTAKLAYKLLNYCLGQTPEHR